MYVEEEIRLSQSSFPVSQIGFCWLGRDFDDRFRSPGERPTGPIALAQSTCGKSREKCDPHFGFCYASNWSLTSQLRQATSQPRLLQGFSLEIGRGS